ncbi:MAG TPA: alginate lyase family protein [Tepidisphaeraceae bacterium]
MIARPWIAALMVCIVTSQTGAGVIELDLRQLERDRVLKVADAYLSEAAVTVTASRCDRSAGGLHDFYSEGDYWWPNPADPGGAYIQRDGMTNPQNFVEHRRAMVRMSIHVATLTAAWRLTHDRKYADHAIGHFRAWFVDESTRMNPNLQFAQAIKGVSTGRGIGVIDTIHLVEVARAASLLEKDKLLAGKDLDGTRRWFSDYIHWMTTSKNGLDEKKAANNHGTCWVMQVAAFAAFVGDEGKLAECRTQFKQVLLPDQMAADGSFPRELKRTKPYGYSLFNLDAMATICQILSTPGDDLWKFTTTDGRSMQKAVAFMYPYMMDKSKWPGKPDVMFWEFWPVRSPALIFAGIAYGEPKYLELWKSLEANPTNEEVLRNLPLRQALLWVDK